MVYTGHRFKKKIFNLLRIISCDKRKHLKNAVCTEGNTYTYLREREKYARHINTRHTYTERDTLVKSNKL